MKSTWQVIGLLVFSLLLPACSKPPQISAADRAEVRRIADEVGQAAEKLDVNRMLQHLSLDAELSLAGQQFSVKTYEQYLNKIFPHVSDYTYLRSNESMQLAPNGSDIILKFQVNEQYTIKNKRFNETHQETYHLRKEAGRFKVYKVVAS